MPIENERKVVLEVADPAAFRAELGARGTAIRIIQHYLPGGVRIRHAAPVRPTHDEQWYLTYKAMVGDDLIEIETTITKADYDKLLTIAECSIRKTRIAIPHDGYLWEVDFFVDDADDIYLLLAEVEMPPGQEAMPSAPDFIWRNMLHNVTKHDRLFSNRALTDPAKVRQRIATLKLRNWG